jgi:hypothetical protein
VTEARVVVEFVAPRREPSRGRGIAYFGMFAPVDGVFTSDEDIEAVKKSLNPREF